MTSLSPSSSSTSEIGDTMSEAAPAVATDEEMEHYLMFPDVYCRGCEGGMGPLCIDCCNDDARWPEAA